MTDAKPPALFDWATELSDAQGHVTLSEQEAHEIGARLRRPHFENETLQVGYAAARLEIESLQARIKTMAEGHADELMVAHLDGRMRAAQPAGAQQPGAAYAALPGQEVPSYSDDALLMVRASELRAFADATHALRASHGQAPAQAAHSSAAQTANCTYPTCQIASGCGGACGRQLAQAAPAYKDSTPELHVGDSAFESWYSTYNPAHKADKQRARDAYAAGMGDPLVTAAPAQPAHQQEAQGERRHTMSSRARTRRDKRQPIPDFDDTEVKK